MKNQFIYMFPKAKRFILAITVMIALSACNDFLTVPLESTVATSNFYKTASDFNMGLTGVYNVLTGRDGGDRYGSYFSGFLFLGRLGTDEMVILNDYVEKETDLRDYTYTPSHYYLSRTWYMQYRGIQRASVIIDRLLPADIGSASDKSRILGEAHFLRAFYYFQLVRYFGEVPIIKNEITDLNEMPTEKGSLTDVYGQIVADLKEAIQYLPVTNESGRAHYYAAKAMLGKVYLQMAGMPLQDSEAATLAVTELNDVISSGRFSLVENYYSLFDASNEHSSEYIFDIEFHNNGTNTCGGQVGTTDGVQNPASLYTSAIISTQEFYETFNPNDKRRNSIVQFMFEYDENKNLVKKDLSHEPVYYAYKFRHGLTPEDRGSTWINWSNPINFPVIRYSDVLLMYAEAEWRATGSVSVSALEGVNQVRRRGFEIDIYTPNPSVDLTVTSGTALENALIAERGYELHFEGQRWHDLVRFGKLQEAINSLNNDRTLTNTVVKAYENFNPNKHTIYPIPQDVIDTSNGKITQNPIWE